MRKEISFIVAYKSRIEERNGKLKTFWMRISGDFNEKE